MFINNIVQSKTLKSLFLCLNFASWGDTPAHHERRNLREVSDMDKKPEVSDVKENKSNILADDVKELWIETEDGELIAHITRGDEEVIVKDGYRVKIELIY